MSKKLPPLPIIPPKLPFDFMRFDLGARLPLLDQFIRHRRTPMRLTYHVICPCVKPPRQGGTGEAIPDCPSCSGTGFAYPGTGEEVDGVVQGVSANDEHTENGTRSTGQISVVLTTETSVAEGDRFHLYRTIVPIRHSRQYKKALGGMGLPFDVRDVRNLVTNEPTTLEIVPLTRGKDFSLNAEKNFISFPRDGVVRDGATVSGVFMVAPYYIVQSLSSAFRGQLTSAYSKEGGLDWIKMPQTAIAIRSDLLFGRFEREVTNRGSIEDGEGS